MSAPETTPSCCSDCRCSDKDARIAELEERLNTQKVITDCYADEQQKQLRDNKAAIARIAELTDALRLALDEAESWVHDQLDGTGSLASALAILNPARVALSKAKT
jgi:hypothetical protein